MPHWYVKAALQGSMALLPNPQAANRLFQRHVTKRLVLDQAYFDSKVLVARRHLANFSDVAGGQSPDHSLELGTGWLPLVPIAQALIGGGHVTTLDIERLMSESEVIQTLEMFTSAIEATSSGYSDDALSRVEAALNLKAQGLDQMLGAVGVTSVVGDAMKTNFGDNTFDFVTSNNTFEHIPLDALRAILVEFARVAKPSGFMSHLIDLADHYAGFDGSITPYNFLAYSESQWRKFNNSLQYQNRMRWPDYEMVLREAGWNITDSELQGDLAQLAKVDVHVEFSRFSDEELATHTAWVVTSAGRSQAFATSVYGGHEAGA